MDPAPRSPADHLLAVTGLGCEASPDVFDLLAGRRPDPAGVQLAHDCHPGAFLRVRKTLKFMSRQDRLALCAAGKALADAQVGGDLLREGCGVFMAVGYIPFQLDRAAELCAASADGDRFSMEKFSSRGFDRVHPLLAFSCLPNMPAHHIAANFDIRGEYFITYPGPAQLCLALQEAACRIREGRIKIALVGGVADQTNFLVENHFRKCHPASGPLLADAAGFMTLELEDHAFSRGKTPLMRLVSLETGQAATPFRQESGLVSAGPGELPLALAAHLDKQDKSREFVHICGEAHHRWMSRWEKP